MTDFFPVFLYFGGDVLEKFIAALMIITARLQIGKAIGSF